MRPRSPLTTGIFIALAVIAILLALWLIYRLQAVIVLILIATIIATGVDPLIDRMQGWRLPLELGSCRALYQSCSCC